jgi:hypothetical protein
MLKRGVHLLGICAMVSLGLCLSSSLIADDHAFSTVQPEMKRITVAFEKRGPDVILAASFVYGEYVNRPTDQDGFLDSDDLLEKFNQLPETDRWKYPEYVVIRHFQEWKANNKEGLLACYVPGFDREKERLSYVPISEQERAYAGPLTRIVFFYKAYFGPYVRIAFLASEVMPSGSTKGGKAVPGFMYLKQVNNRYGVTKEIDSLNIIDPVVSEYGYNNLKKEGRKLPVDPNTTGMDWFAIDVDDASAAEKKEYLRVFSVDKDVKIPQEYSENYLKIYVRGEPLNIQIKPGQKIKGLSPQLELFQSAVTAHQLGSESEILSMWSDRTKERLQKEIQVLIDRNEWPQRRLYIGGIFSKAPTVVCQIQTSENVMLYYSDSVKINSDDPLYTIGIRKEKGEYKLFSPSSVGRLNILDNSMFVNALKVLYGDS